MDYFRDENFLAQGILEWPVSERDTGRYGVITLYDGPGPMAKRVIVTHRAEGYGALSALVTATKPIRHYGDPRLGILPKRPEVNDRFILGRGIVSYPDFRSIKLEPIIKVVGKTDMDVEALYNVINQEVKIYFTKE